MAKTDVLKYEWQIDCENFMMNKLRRLCVCIQSEQKGKI